MVFAGVKPKEEGQGKRQQWVAGGKSGKGGKRKAEDEGVEKDVGKPLSKTQMRKRARQAKLEKAKETADAPSKTVTESRNSEANGEASIIDAKGQE